MFNFLRSKSKKEDAYTLGYNLGKNAIDVSVFDTMRKRQKNNNTESKNNNTESKNYKK